MIKRVFAFAALAAVAICGTSLIRPAGAEFSQQGSYGGVSSGSANAQVISLANLAALSQLRGVTISFIVGAGLTNSGPATIGVNSLSPVSIERMNSGTLMPLGGAEMPAGKMVKAFFDGTEFVLETDYTGGENVGTSKITNYATADPGYALEFGQAISRTQEPALFAKIGTTYGAGDGSTTFNLPDKRGRTIFGQDNMGGTAANRITATISGIAGTTLGAAGGTQGIAGGIPQADLASFAMAGGTSGTLSVTVSGATTNGPGVSPQQGNASGSDLQCCLWNSSSGLPLTATGTTSGSLPVTVGSGGGALTVSTTSPGQIVDYEIKL